MTLQEKFKTICEEYIQAFFKKHGYYDEETDEYFPYEAVQDNPAGIINVGDLFIDFDDMRLDIDRDVPEHVYLEYYNYCLQRAAQNKEIVNYYSYLMMIKEK